MKFSFLEIYLKLKRIKKQVFCCSTIQAAGTGTRVRENKIEIIHVLQISPENVMRSDPNGYQIHIVYT